MKVFAQSYSNYSADIAPLPGLLKIRSQYSNCMLMVDEARSFGVNGKTAKGIEEHFKCRGQIDILMGP